MRTDRPRYRDLSTLYQRVRRQGHQSLEQRALGRTLAAEVDWATDGVTVPSWDSVMVAANVALRPD